jgi:hypothetical protein
MKSPEIVSFALNWAVYKFSDNTYWVGGDGNVEKQFSNLNLAISYMLYKIYC